MVYKGDPLKHGAQYGFLLRCYLEDWCCFKSFYPRTLKHSFDWFTAVYYDYLFHSKMLEQNDIFSSEETLFILS